MLKTIIRAKVNSFSFVVFIINEIKTVFSYKARLYCNISLLAIFELSLKDYVKKIKNDFYFFYINFLRKKTSINLKNYNKSLSLVKLELQYLIYFKFYFFKNYDRRLCQIYAKSSVKIPR